MKLNTNMKKRFISIFLCTVFLCSLCFQNVFAAGEISVNLELSGKTLTLSGTGVASLKRVVAVKITDPDGNIFNLNEIKAEEDGSFSYAVVLSDSDASGFYTATAAVRGGADEKSDTVYYLSDGLKNQVESLINSACEISGSFETEMEAFEAAVANVTEKLELYRAELGIEEMTDAELRNGAIVLIWLKPSTGYDFDVVSALCNRSVSVAEQLVECDENTLTSFLKTNSDIFFEDEALYDKYASFSSANKRSVNSSVLSALPYSDFAEIRAAISSEVNKIASGIEIKKLYIEGDIDINVISVSGSGTVTARKTVTVKITAPNGSISNINQIEANKDGTFEYSAALDSAGVSGTYTVAAFSRGIDEISEFTVFYLSEADRTSIKNSVNSAVASTDIEALLKENKVKMGISSLTNNELKSAAIVLKEQEPAGGYEYEEMLTVISETKELTDKLAKAGWLTLDELMQDNHLVLLSGVSEYEKYSELSDANRNKLCKEILKSSPFASIEDFRIAFETEVGAFKESSSSDSSGGGGGGSSGGGGGGSSAGGGGGASSSGSGFASSGAFNAISEYTTPESSVVSKFSDLAGYEWASESIEGLLAKGVVSPSEDGKFRPSDNITRAEFIKLVVCAFSLTDNGAECSFTDVLPENWYYVYVASAAKHGITNGKDDGSFGVGENIKRQDMAVLALRTAESLGYTLIENTAEKEFADGDQIAEYAKEAVSSMQKSGIINGDDTGNFRPEGSASRAEAAKIIYMLISAVKK